MGDMYRIDLSNLPTDEREKAKNMLESAGEVFLVANQPYVFDILWTDAGNISEILKLPEKCSIKKF